MNKYALFFLFCFAAFFIVQCDTIKIHENQVKIAIQPFGNFDEHLTKIVAKAIEKTYGFEVRILPSIDLPKDAFINVKSPRYRADKLIRFLKETKADSFDYVLGLTNRDISTTIKDKLGKTKEPSWKYEDWGIFGLGYRPGPSCIVSTFRLQQNNRAIFINRLEKVSVHELGHNLGLPHCDTKHCVMQDANEKISTVDGVSGVLCDECKNQIKIK